LVRKKTRCKIKILAETEEDQKRFEEFREFEDVTSLERSLRGVGKIDSTLIEKYSKRYSAFQFQKLRISTNLRGTHLFKTGSSSFAVVLCRYLAAIEGIIADLRPDFICLTLGEAFNHPCIPILDAVCQIQNKPRIFVSNPMSRISVTDNMARVSREIGKTYVHKLKTGLSDREKQGTIDSIESYMRFKRGKDFKLVLGKHKQALRDRENIWRRRFSQNMLLRCF
jgi:hypothetical protein